MVFVDIWKICKFVDLLEPKYYCQTERMAESFKPCLTCFCFFFLNIFENIFLILWWSSLKSVFHEIIFSLISDTMVFLFIVWMGVVFKINTAVANLLVYWNKNNIASRKRKHEDLCPVSYSFYLKREPYF